MEESWVCVDGHGDERIFPCKPYRDFPNMQLDVMWGQRWTTGPIDTEFKKGVLLPKGTIKHLIGKEMNYDDEPIKLILMAVNYGHIRKEIQRSSEVDRKYLPKFEPRTANGGRSIFSRTQGVRG